jgi:hypothetical protein
MLPETTQIVVESIEMDQELKQSGRMLIDRIVHLKDSL